MNAKLLGAFVIGLVAIFGAAFFFMGQGSSSLPPSTTSAQIVGAQTTETAPSPKSYTLADVATHASASSCWAAINGKVYDLTNWINQHPGGSDPILSICGKDGSSAFNAQHSGQSRPERELANFYVADLVTK